MEVEKKYLINNYANNINLDNYKCDEISQYYISFNPEIRLRCKKGDKVTCFLTYKDGVGLVRNEIENEVSYELYENFKHCLKGRIIEKKRYKIPLDEIHIIELDIYHGELDGLKVAEIEFSNINEANSFNNIPSWFGAEVTSDKSFKNKNLAKIDISDLTILINKYLK